MFQQIQKFLEVCTFYVFTNLWKDLPFMELEVLSSTNKILSFLKGVFRIHKHLLIGVYNGEPETQGNARPFAEQFLPAICRQKRQIFHDVICIPNC